MNYLTFRQQLEKHNDPEEVRQRLAAGNYSQPHAGIAQEYLDSLSRKDAAKRIYALEMDVSLLSATYVAFYWQEGGDAYSVFIFEEKVSLSLFGRTVEGKRGSFDDVLIVNFRKIREEIDQALT